MHLLDLAGTVGADLKEVDTWVRAVLDQRFETEPEMGALAEVDLEMLLVDDRPPYRRPTWPVNPETKIMTTAMCRRPRQRLF